MNVLTQKIKTISGFFRQIPKKYYIIAGVLVLVGVYALTFRERTLTYSYMGETCDQRLVLLPGVFQQTGSENYDIEAHGGWSVGEWQVFATSICLSPVTAPTENATEVVAFSPWGGGVARLSYAVQAQEHPKVHAHALDQPVPVHRELLLPLDQPDETFSYKLEANKKQAPCDSGEQELICDVPALDLRQGSTYKVKLKKYFKAEEVSAVVEADMETLSPLRVVESSIKKGATVYGKPKSVTLRVDKSLKEAKFIVERVDKDKKTNLDAETVLSDQKATVTFADELPRQATIQLTAEEFEGTDGSTTLDDYTLEFKTSGGPKVTGVNVGSSGVMVGTSIVVTFDQELSLDQSIDSLIEVGGGVAFQAKQGNQLLFTTNGVPRCGNISITLKDAIQSRHGISGQSAWQYSGRMSCYSISTIGHSVQGRPITAYHFGNSGPSIVYTGAIHGNEASTKYLMDRWIQELNANPGKIPANKRIVVVPAINPDGLAAGTRMNARNVDLNRNFATNNWKKDVQYVNGQPFPGGGGASKMSEPETRAIANLISQQRPELVLSYHSVANLIVTNNVGRANARASQYAGMSGYRLGASDGNDFSYTITGSADSYYGEAFGIPSIVIELGSHTYHEFERNQAAMWAMMR